MRVLYYFSGSDAKLFDTEYPCLDLLAKFHFISICIDLIKGKAVIILRPQLLFVPPAVYRQPSAGFLQVRIP